MDDEDRFALQILAWTFFMLGMICAILESAFDFRPLAYVFFAFILLAVASMGAAVVSYVRLYSDSGRGRGGEKRKKEKEHGDKR